MILKIPEGRTREQMLHTLARMVARLVIISGKEPRDHVGEHDKFIDDWPAFEMLVAFHETAHRLSDQHVDAVGSYRTLASRYHDMEGSEWQVKMVIEQCGVDVDSDEFSFFGDNYDNSLEIFGANPVTFNPQPLWDAGFGQVWVHKGLRKGSRCDAGRADQLAGSCDCRARSKYGQST